MKPQAEGAEGRQAADEQLDDDGAEQHQDEDAGSRGRAHAKMGRRGCRGARRARRSRGAIGCRGRLDWVCSVRRNERDGPAVVAASAYMAWLIRRRTS